MRTEQDVISFIVRSTNATSAHKIESLQRLWGGYGTIDRFALANGITSQVIVKHISPPDIRSHPRGWNTDTGHQRKIRSYEVETNWYRKWSSQCGDWCRLPACIATHQDQDGIILILEDLDHAGYPRRLQHVDLDSIALGLEWLAHFHVLFLMKKPDGLWPIGTYWHLATRPEELAVLDDRALKAAASKIDGLLNASPYQTFVHGDAKLANFCFSEDLTSIAAVDFQYVGGGVGVKDVAYFIGSCLDEPACAKYTDTLLDQYFHSLKHAYAICPNSPDIDYYSMEKDWRKLFPLAWADFHRFLKGWSPGHWKINSYSEQVCREVLAQIA